MLKIKDLFKSSGAKNVEQKADNKDSVTEQYEISRIINLIKKEDVIDIQILVDGKIIYIGAASDCTRSGEFFDKIYYISPQEYDEDLGSGHNGQMEFSTIEEFQNGVMQYAPDGMIRVYLIDDEKPEYYNIP